MSKIGLSKEEIRKKEDDRLLYGTGCKPNQSISDIVKAREEFKKNIKFRVSKDLGEVEHLIGKITFEVYIPFTNDHGYKVDPDQSYGPGITARSIREEEAIDLIIERISKDMEKLKEPVNEFQETAVKYKEELKPDITSEIVLKKIDLTDVIKETLGDCEEIGSDYVKSGDISMNSQDPIERTELPEKNWRPVNNYRSDKRYYIGDKCMYGGVKWRLDEGKGSESHLSLGYPPYKHNGWSQVDLPEKKIEPTAKVDSSEDLKKAISLISIGVSRIIGEDVYGFFQLGEALQILKTLNEEK